MAQIKLEREKAEMCAKAAVRAKYRSGEDTWIGPTIIDMEIRTAGVFKDIYVVGASLKQTQDGLCRAVLPLGDGHKTPYQWNTPTQVRVKTRAEQGVLVHIREA